MEELTQNGDTTRLGHCEEQSDEQSSYRVTMIFSGLLRYARK